MKTASMMTSQEIAAHQRAEEQKDRYRLNYIENLYSSGDNREWHKFMGMVCEYGFRRAADMRRTVPVPNASGEPRRQNL
jgi:hypothetical protein